MKPSNDLESIRTGVMVGSGIGGLDGIRKSADNLKKIVRERFPLFYSLMLN